MPGPTDSGHARRAARNQGACPEFKGPHWGPAGEFSPGIGEEYAVQVGTVEPGLAWAATLSVRDGDVQVAGTAVSRLSEKTRVDSEVTGSYL